ncbi:MAG: penicillin acylase family protein [Candidatus Heimdallarchaeota archaeon]|nr:penicillin acylase family protein [Candidatus Heimdallarchaeota archaeon]
MDLDQLQKSSQSQMEGTLVLEGINLGAEIIRDKFGVPHIFADDHEDLYFAFGYVHAQDRLWQMEMYRRLGEGSLSELLGEGALVQDKFYRTLGLYIAAKRDEEAFLSKGNPDAIKVLLAYFRGINTFIDTNQETLPLEFKLLNVTPKHFAIVDGLLIGYFLSMGLARNFTAEILRLDIMDSIDEYFGREIYALDPTDGIRSYAVPGFSSILDPPGQGSNNWVVSGEKSVTGKPLLANDPHVFNTIPALWEVVHLHYNDRDIIGGTVPGLPNMIVGHNKNVAFGITNSYADVQDGYIIKLNPENNQQYRYNDSWVDMDKREETILVKGKDPVVYNVLLTKFGPIIEHLIDGHVPKIYQRNKNTKIAFRYMLDDEFDECLFNITPQLLFMNTGEDFKNIVKSMNFLSQNYVYADINGDIGYTMTGKIPIRKKGDGTIPAPGWTDEYEWTGYIPDNEMPQSTNPGCNFIATANNKVVSNHYPHLITKDWIRPYRINRIIEMLSEKERLSVEDFHNMQMDTFSLSAKDHLPYFLEITPTDSFEQRCLEYVQVWDMRYSAESTAALIYEVWNYTLSEMLLADKIGEDVFSRNHFWFSILPLLKFPSNLWFDRGSNSNIENRRAVIGDAFHKTVVDLKEKLGENVDEWKWGDLHQLQFNHPMGSAFPDPSLLNRGPFDIGGSGSTINAAFYYYPTTEFNLTVGPTYRQIIDLDDFNNSKFIVIPGQSGNQFNNHYADMIDPWLKGKLHPLLIDREKIIENKEMSLVLEKSPE